MTASSSTSLTSLEARFRVEIENKNALMERFRVRIPSYYAGLIEKPGDPIWKQCVPSSEELIDDGLPADPLGEDAHMPVPQLTHKYPDRVLFLITDRCPMYCRFCTRKRKTHAKEHLVSEDTVEQGLAYIREHTEIREVILSGGEPLSVPLKRLDYVLSELKKCAHVKWTRIHTKVPCVDPGQVTVEMVNVLRRYHPLFVHVHFNHPRELTPQAGEALARLADAGIQLGSHTVLLKGVNDDLKTLKDLFEGLLQFRVRPYYLLLADPCMGTAHFRTTLEEGLSLLDGLRGWNSGMMVPQLMMEGPEGKGKVPVVPGYVEFSDSTRVRYRSYDGTVLEWPQGGVTVQ